MEMKWNTYYQLRVTGVNCFQCVYYFPWWEIWPIRTCHMISTVCDRKYKLGYNDLCEWM